VLNGGRTTANRTLYPLTRLDSSFTRRTRTRVCVHSHVRTQATVRVADLLMTFKVDAFNGDTMLLRAPYRRALEYKLRVFKGEETANEQKEYDLSVDAAYDRVGDISSIGEYLCDVGETVKALAERDDQDNQLT